MTGTVEESSGVHWKRASGTKSAGKGRNRGMIIGGGMKEKQNSVTWPFSDFVMSRLSLRIGLVTLSTTPGSASPTILWRCLSLALFLHVGRQVSLRWHCDAAAACQMFTSLCLSVTLCSFFSSSSRHWGWTATSICTTLAPSPFPLCLLFFSLTWTPVF